MFEIVKKESYDTHHSYGTDWHFDYTIKSDEDLSIDEVIEKCAAYGVCELEKTEDGYILRTKMY